MKRLRNSSSVKEERTHFGFANRSVFIIANITDRIRDVQEIKSKQENMRMKICGALLSSVSLLFNCCSSWKQNRRNKTKHSFHTCSSCFRKNSTRLFFLCQNKILRPDHLLRTLDHVFLSESDGSHGIHIPVGADAADAPSTRNTRRRFDSFRLYNMNDETRRPQTQIRLMSGFHDSITCRVRAAV